MNCHVSASRSTAWRRRLERWLSPSRFSRWSIGTRIIALVLTVAVPLNLVIFAVV